MALSSPEMYFLQNAFPSTGAAEGVKGMRLSFTGGRRKGK